MPQENVDVARRLWERIVEGGRTQRADTGLADPAWHPDLEYVEDPTWPGSGVYRGLDAIRARFDEYLDIFGATEVQVIELLDAGSDVVSIFRTRGQSARSGLPFEHEWAWVWTFRDGRVIRWRAYFDKEHALKFVGLR
jgi:ketosteroid isomerase-like protein